MAQQTGNPYPASSAEGSAHLVAFGSRWLPTLIGVLAGVLLGLVIGWVVWPVDWRNALPTDMRPNERDTYLLMTAESYAQNKDVRTAQDRLTAWSPDLLARDLTALQARLTGINLQSAGQVQALMTALNARPAQSGVPTPKPTARPTAEPSTSGLADTMTQLRRIGTVLLWVILFFGALVGFGWLYMRLRRSQTAQGGPAIDEAVVTARTPHDLAGRAKQALSGAPRDTIQQPLPAMEWLAEGEEPEADREEPGGEPFVAPIAPIPLPSTRPEPKPAPVAATPPRPVDPARRGPAVAAAPAAGPFAKIGEFKPTFQMGEPDYDEAFDINDGGFIGQCGLELTDPIGRARDQAAALQAWLWDATDPDTQVVVLMSEGAYRDTALRDQLAGAEHPIVQVRPGIEFQLETHKLLLRGTVDRMRYGDGEPPNGIFAELGVKLTVYRKA